MNRLFPHVIAGAIALSATVLLSACASPVEGLWPPPQESVQHTVSVSIDTWHAMIAFPREDRTEHPALGSQHSYEEWGYAERAWYLEGRMGVSGVARALFWPTEGVVLKVDYRQRDFTVPGLADFDALDLGFGYAF